MHRCSAFKGTTALRIGPPALTFLPVGACCFFFETPSFGYTPLQTFVIGFRDAKEEMEIIDWNRLPEHVVLDFQHKLERLVVLDYVIRNTDRGMDNWLIKYNPGSASSARGVGGSLGADRNSSGSNSSVGGVGGGDSGDGSISPAAAAAEPSIEVAAIDNGLAFPYKHPDDWRSYPYEWEYMVQAQQPFSEQIVSEILPFLSDQNRVEQMVESLRLLHKTNPTYKASLFEQQMAVMRGQMINLREALRERKSPAELVAMPNSMIFLGGGGADDNSNRGGGSSSKAARKYRQVVAKSLPFFRKW